MELSLVGQRSPTFSLVAVQHNSRRFNRKSTFNSIIDSTKVHNGAYCCTRSLAAARTQRLCTKQVIPGGASAVSTTAS